ncbi:MAG: hypothetical protein K2P78_12800 [Gemmataceae bacterium]|nr:hypothetical protein [Gemmataceae bacterium]
MFRRMTARVGGALALLGLMILLQARALADPPEDYCTDTCETAKFFIQHSSGGNPWFPASTCHEFDKYDCAWCVDGRCKKTTNSRLVCLKDDTQTVTITSREVGGCSALCNLYINSKSQTSAPTTPMVKQWSASYHYCTAPASRDAGS